MPTWSATRRQLARRGLLDAAGDVIAERGWPSASVHHIGQRAGLSRGAVNYHFGTREQLLDEVLDDLIARHRAAWADDPDPPALEDLLDRIWAVVADDPRGTRLATMLFYESLGPSPHLTDRSRWARRELVAALEAQLRRLQFNGKLRSDADCRSAAAFLVSALAGLTADSDRDAAAALGYAELRATLVARLA